MLTRVQGAGERRGILLCTLTASYCPFPLSPGAAVFTGGSVFSSIIMPMLVQKTGARQGI